MPTPLQTVITLPLYYHPYTHIDLSVRRNEKNEKAAAERKQIPPYQENLTFQTKFSNKISKSSDLLPTTTKKGDPCKLTMEDLFPSRPEPPTSEDKKQPEDESEDWLIEWDRENRDKNN